MTGCSTGRPTRVMDTGSANCGLGSCSDGSGSGYEGLGCYDWVSSEEGETSETGRSAELTFVQRDWS